MLLTEARTGPDGILVTLDEQDRSRWDPAAIAEVTELTARSPGDGPGR